MPGSDSSNRSAPSPSEVLKDSSKQIPRLPRDTEPEGGDRVTRATAVGLTTGVVTQAIYPEITNQTAGITVQDEVTAVAAGLSAALLASINLPKLALCKEPGEKGRENIYSAAAGSAGTGGLFGTLAGVGVKAGLFTAPFDGGATLIGSLAGVGLFTGGTLLARRWIKRGKECPHCNRRGNCSQRVCRHCYRMFYPHERIDCSEVPYLDWYMIASELQAKGTALNFSYLDAEELYKKRGHKEWKWLSPDGAHAVKCKEFEAWLMENDTVLEDYAGKGSRGKDPKAIDNYLRKQVERDDE